MTERVTIDLGLNFDNGNKKKFFDKVIVEVKRDNSSSSSQLPLIFDERF